MRGVRMSRSRSARVGKGRKAEVRLNIADPGISAVTLKRILNRIFNDYEEVFYLEREYLQVGKQHHMVDLFSVTKGGIQRGISKEDMESEVLGRLTRYDVEHGIEVFETTGVESVDIVDADGWPVEVY